MDGKVRVVVATRPRLMREMMLAMLAEEPRIEVVGETDREEQVPELVAARRPDFLLMAAAGESGKRPALCDLLLKEYPGLRIIAVAAASNVSVYYWASLEIHARTMEGSGEALLEAMKGRAAAPARA
jgi:DNA-binding NarL/FixJ family response regulator